MDTEIERRAAMNKAANDVLESLQGLIIRDAQSVLDFVKSALLEVEVKDLENRGITAPEW